MKHPSVPRIARTCCAAAIAFLASTAGLCAQETRSPSELHLSARALATIRLLPIQHNGRHKPFDSFARETLDQIIGSPRIGRTDPVVTVLSIIAEPEHWQNQPLLLVPFRPLGEALGLDPKASHVSQEALLTTRRLMRMLPPIVEKQRRDEKLSILEQETMDLFDRFVAFSNLVEHRLELVPPSSPGDSTWRSIQQPEGYPLAKQTAMKTVWAAWIAALRGGRQESIEEATSQLTSMLNSLNPSAYPPSWRLRLEVFYNRYGPFRVARTIYLIAVTGLLLGLIMNTRWTTTGGMVAFGIAAILHAIGILMRVAIGGRPPVSNFFETMLWLPFVGVVLALLFERIYRATYFALSASVLSAVMLWLSDYVPLDASISPVVAVLRSNLWLTVHVLTIVASYGALALATVLAHVYGVLFLRSLDSPAVGGVVRDVAPDGSRDRPESFDKTSGLGPEPSRRAERAKRVEGRRTWSPEPSAGAPRGQKTALALLDTFLYRAIQVGVVLLAAGIMLGAVWANASWGRYWGWDPKETWALITLLWFLAVLHGRFAGWLKGVSVALCTISGFFLLLMTYYGVSFYLVGLHSYAGGHAKPLPSLLVAYLIAELAFMAFVGLSALRSRRPV